MKVIQSAGGALIGIDREFLHLWSANTGKAFVGENSPYVDDYEALGRSPDGARAPPRSIAIFSGIVAEALLITMPFETAIIQSDLASVFLAQVEYADPDWSFSKVTMHDFEATTFSEKVSFHAKKSTYLLFDSAYLPSEMSDDYLQFELLDGDYQLSAGFRQPDDRTSLLLYRILRAP